MMSLNHPCHPSPFLPYKTARSPAADMLDSRQPFLFVRPKKKSHRETKQSSCQQGANPPPPKKMIPIQRRALTCQT